jgi:pimeloyl-ACP methyl ester carboxylesterase
MESIENKQEYPTFDEQFKNVRSFEHFGGVVEYVDITPEHLKTEVPMIIAPGWSETQDTFRDSLRIMSERGRRVIGITHARGGGSVDMGDVEGEYPEEELRKAFAILQILEENHIPKADVVAHSEGGINTAIAATIDTEKFRNIVFVNIGGLIGKDNFPRLTGGFTMNLIQEALYAIKNKINEKVAPLVTGEDATDHRTPRTAVAATGLAKYIFQNFTRALRESVAISEAQVQEMIGGLHEKGVGVVIVNGVDDSVFPMEKMQEVVKAEKIDGFISVKGNHNEIYANPEQWMPAVDTLFDSLEKKKAKEKE